MSDTQQPDGSWQATDGKWYPRCFWVNNDQYYADPSGRHGYRMAEEGRWTEYVMKNSHGLRRRTDPEGAVLLAEVPVPVPLLSVDEAEAIPGQGTSTSPTVSSDQEGISLALEVIGWIAILLSIIGGFAIGANASVNGEAVTFGFVFAGAGTIQGLLLVGFGRVIRYAKEITTLLKQAVEPQN